MFEVNWSTVINWLMHPLMRTAFNLNFLNALLMPFKDVYNAFKLFRDTNIYKLSHTGQVCYLEGALNDAFDTDLRRLRIEDAGSDEIILLSLDTDETPLMVDDDITGAILIHNDSAYFNSDYDFIVIIPYAFSSSELYRLKALVDYYKLAGKRYDVIVG
ncbi:MAG: hypothetical protein IMY72_11700 [Bacteroidetes bacterium]|nr:hypothetical protein [Bacteroidota bacterium]